MGVQKTVRRCGRTLEHGSFEARESIHVCLAGCRQPTDGKGHAADRLPVRQPACRAEGVYVIIESSVIAAGAMTASFTPALSQGRGELGA
jgi:hypothetical protein